MSHRVVKESYPLYQLIIFFKLLSGSRWSPEKNKQFKTTQILIDTENKTFSVRDRDGRPCSFSELLLQKETKND